MFIYINKNWAYKPYNKLLLKEMPAPTLQCVRASNAIKNGTTHFSVSVHELKS